MVAGSFSVDGLKELEDALLRDVPKKFQRRTMLRAARAAWKPVADTAKRLAPVRSGALRDSIELWNQTEKRSAGFGYAVTVEAGVKKKSAKGRRAMAQAADYYDSNKRLQTKGAQSGGPFWAPWVEHGTRDFPAQPFLGPAYDAHAKQAIDIFAGRMWVEIGKEAEKAARRAKK